MGYVGRLGVHIGCAKGVSDVDVCPLIGLVVVLAELFVVVGGLMVAGGGDGTVLVVVVVAWGG